MFPPIIAENALMMSTEAAERILLSQIRFDQPVVIADGILNKDSSTDNIDVNVLPKECISVIQHVEIAEKKSRLYCVNKALSISYWLKIVTFAKDCLSYNVQLMTTDNGVILKTTKHINSGEPLLMWFAEDILHMLDVPTLMPFNIRGHNCYVCHKCNNLFKYPNPLKIHLTLQCNQLDSNYLWIALAEKFSLSPRFSPSFKLNLTDNESPSSSNQPSPSSSNESSSSSTEVSPMRKFLDYRFSVSAFKPYMNQPNVSASVCLPGVDETVLTLYNVQPNAALINKDNVGVYIDNVLKALEKSQQGFQCIYCKKVSTRKYSLKIHLRIHLGYKPLICAICHQQFSDPSNFNKHRRIHDNKQAICRKTRS
ncbi:PR/SET domain 13 [Colletes latitarsis]|uniref:PR/SET domain 13 n=1 Tax=Colletes latitarsis TaxID=2605962 RepID=UPI0040367496